MPHHETKGQPDGGEAGRRGGGGRFVFAGLLGALVGAAAAMLLSPWSGSEARLQLKQRSKELAEGARRKFREKTGEGEE